MTNENSSAYARPKDIDNRATFGQRVMWRIETIAWDFIYWGPMKMMGPDRASNFGGWLMRKLGPRLSQHKTTRRNLRLAFPDWADDKVEETALAAWESVGRTAGEMPHMPKMNPAHSDRIEIVGVEHLDQVRSDGKGAVMVSGHFANWEVLGITIYNRAPEAVATYRALNNPHIDKRINDMRKGYGIEAAAPKGIGTRDLMRALSRGVPIGLMNDQKFREGIAVPFFGYDAMTAPGPTRLAMRYGAPILLVSTVRTGPARFRIEFHEPFMPENTGDEEADIRATVMKINAFLENHVRAYPGQWFWQHQRWPKQAWRDAGVI